METMKERELRQLLDSLGWNLITRERHGKRRNAVYLLARSKVAPYQMVHITSRRELPIIDQEEVVEKIKAATG